MDLPLKIVKMFNSMSREDRSFAGGILHRTSIVNQLSNWTNYKANDELPNRRRINMGVCEFGKDDSGEIPIGYCSFSILRNAKPTKYEREIIGLDNLLNYVQIRNIFVPIDYRDSDVSYNLFANINTIARENSLSSFCADVMSENKSGLGFFKNIGMSEDFYWSTPSGNQMIRMSNDCC